jgi:hypothetical protein
MTTIDQKAEEKYLVWKPSTQMTKAQQDIAFTNFAHDVADEVNVQLLTVEERTRIGYRFELLNLKNAVLAATTPENKSKSSTDSYQNPSINGENRDKNTEQSTNGNYSEKIEAVNYSTLFKDVYNNTSYRNADLSKGPKVYDIYKDGQMKKVMDKILDSEDKLSNGTFGINLSKEN